MRTEKETTLLADVREVARLLDCSPRHVWALSASGRMPIPLRLGRAARWNLPELRDWLAAGAPDRETWERMKGVGDDQ